MSDIFWDIIFHPECEKEISQLSEAVQDELFAMVTVLKEFGPTLGRPRADTLNDSAFKNMKELRFQADKGIWRTAFAFDPHRRAVILVAANKKGKNQRQFYRNFIAQADRRYEEHLNSLS